MMRKNPLQTSLLLLACLLAAGQAWAAAPVEERAVTGDQVEAAQRRADFAWKQMDDAEQQVRSAEQDVAEAERQERQARQRAEEAARKLEQARKNLADAQARRKAAQERWERTSRDVGQVWDGKGKPGVR
ncbi:MAG: hypothetical protein AB7U30_08110 [Sulfuricellaceae bacterium]|jgi:septal ring factor EnvC (AmiA/AmiB activator)